MELADDWAELLRAEAAEYAQVALTNIRREFPSGVYHDMTAPGDFPFRPKARSKTVTCRSSEKCTCTEQSRQNRMRGPKFGTKRHRNAASGSVSVWQ